MTPTSFDGKVARQARELTQVKWWRLEREVAARRDGWFATAPGQACLGAIPTPRQAFETLFSDYMGLDPADLPVVRQFLGRDRLGLGQPLPHPGGLRALGTGHQAGVPVRL